MEMRGSCLGSTTVDRADWGGFQGAHSVAVVLQIELHPVPVVEGFRRCHTSKPEVGLALPQPITASQPSQPGLVPPHLRRNAAPAAAAQLPPPFDEGMLAMKTIRMSNTLSLLREV